MQQLKRVAVEFNPLGAGARPAREFLGRCLGPKARASNPRCKVEQVLSEGSAPARVAVEFGACGVPPPPPPSPPPRLPGCAAPGPAGFDPSRPRPPLQQALTFPFAREWGKASFRAGRA